MTLITILILGFLIILFILQAFPVLKYSALLRSCVQNLQDSEQLPKAAIILCLRGSDPFLESGVRALLHQNYPEYKLHVIVDSEIDSAWPIVKQTIEKLQATNVQLHSLKVRYQTCSLKCSSILQALSELDDSYQAIAFVDGDVIPHPDWLRQLITPLILDDQVGATTGNRWYAPESQQWGSLVRYIWNVGTVIFMYYSQYPWAGSMALRRSVLEQGQMQEQLLQTLCEDGPFGHTLKKLGLKVKFVPSLLMINREECDLKSCLRFITRQFLWVRLYHPVWISAVIYTGITTLVVALCYSFILISLLEGQPLTFIGLGSGLIAYSLGIGGLLAWLEYQVRKVVRPSEICSLSHLQLLKLWIALTLTQFTSAIAIFLARLTRQVEWRGVTYEIKSPWSIRLVKYQPY